MKRKRLKRRWNQAQRKPVREESRWRRLRADQTNTLKARRQRPGKRSRWATLAEEDRMRVRMRPGRLSGSNSMRQHRSHLQKNKPRTVGKPTGQQRSANRHWPERGRSGSPYQHCWTPSTTNLLRREATLLCHRLGFNTYVSCQSVCEKCTMRAFRRQRSLCFHVKGDHRAEHLPLCDDDELYTDASSDACRDTALEKYDCDCDSCESQLRGSGDSAAQGESGGGGPPEQKPEKKWRPQLAQCRVQFSGCASTRQIKYDSRPVSLPLLFKAGSTGDQSRSRSRMYRCWGGEGAPLLGFLPVVTPYSISSSDKTSRSVSSSLVSLTKVQRQSKNHEPCQTHACTLFEAGSSRSPYSDPTAS